MSYTKPTEIDNTPGGDQVNQAVMKNDQNITAAYQALNEIAATVTPTLLLSNIKLVDGPGSELDADTVDGKHASDFLGATAKAVDSDKLDGKHASEFLSSSGTVDNALHLDGNPPSAFLGVNDKAANSDKLDGKHSTEFLYITGTAADSDKLDGKHASEFASVNGDSGKTFYVANPIYSYHAINRNYADGHYVLSSSLSTTATANSVMKRNSDGSAEVSALYVNDDGHKGIFFYNSAGNELYFQDYQGSNHLIISW